MITYESYITCDLCRNQVLGGELHTQPNGALRLAEMAAIKRGWIFRKEKWFCLDCKPKLCPACQFNAPGHSRFKQKSKIRC